MTLNNFHSFSPFVHQKKLKGNQHILQSQINKILRCHETKLLGAKLNFGEQLEFLGFCKTKV